jgi:hypothetical protein
MFQSENFVFIGKDVSFRWVDITSLVNSPTVEFGSSINPKGSEMYGMDDIHFVNDVCLFIFLDGY